MDTNIHMLPIGSISLESRDRSQVWCSTMISALRRPHINIRVLGQHDLYCKTCIKGENTDKGGYKTHWITTMCWILWYWHNVFSFWESLWSWELGKDHRKMPHTPTHAVNAINWQMAELRFRLIPRSNSKACWGFTSFDFPTTPSLSLIFFCNLQSTKIHWENLYVRRDS